MRVWVGIGILVVLVIAIASIIFSGQRKRDDIIFQNNLTTYRSALRTGTSRSQVEDYLRQQGTDFTQGCGESQAHCDRVNLGEEPRNLFCQPWTVYADFQYEGSDSGSEHLTSIDLHREGVCF